MAEFKCVNCGEPAAALYKTYGPSVLKLTKCEKCKGIVDKYIEYDPVIVMIDLVLLSKEAQRHILYNTEFKSFWKLLIILVMLETYGVWRSDSLFNMAINSMCGINSNATINTTYLDIPISIPESWKNNCWAWVPEERGDESDLFIWEKDFYIQFLSTFTGIVVFVLTCHSLMRIMRPFRISNEVSTSRLLKGFSVAEASVLLTLPMLVWGCDAAPPARALHYALAAAYGAASATQLAAVLYECGLVPSFVVVVTGYCAKFATQYHVTPYLREFISAPPSLPDKFVTLDSGAASAGFTGKQRKQLLKKAPPEEGPKNLKKV